MGRDRYFWLLFGGIWLFLGVAFLAATAGVNLFADVDTLDRDTPLWISFAAGLAASAFGGFILRRTLAAAARERRLMQSGIQMSATVTDVRRSRIEINRQTRWHICYRYDYGSQTFAAESAAMPGEMAGDFKLGERVTIAVDPRNPQDSLFVGRA